jgi:thiamine biosynthesis lipoprotein
MAATDHKFRVMGSNAHVVVVGDASLVDYAEHRLRALETAWTRFSPESELSILNASAGRPVVVSEDTFALLARSVDSWRLTGGRFDPTVLGSIVAAGYDRGLNAEGGSGRPTGKGTPAPGCGSIRLQPDSRTVMLPVGTGIDPGGIGKGLAADVVAIELVERGAWGAMVNVGGDLRAVGTPPTANGWVVAIEDPFDAASTITAPRLNEGAVATSTPDHRRWRTPGGPGRHLIDPVSGVGSTTDVASATVLAAQAWMAEAFAKAAALAGFDRAVDVIDDAGLTGIVISDLGAIAISAALGAFL